MRWRNGHFYIESIAYVFINVFVNHTIIMEGKSYLLGWFGVHFIKELYHEYFSLYFLARFC